MWDNYYPWDNCDVGFSLCTFSCVQLHVWPGCLHVHAAACVFCGGGWALWQWALPHLLWQALLLSRFPCLGLHQNRIYKSIRGIYLQILRHIFLETSFASSPSSHVQIGSAASSPLKITGVAGRCEPSSSVNAGDRTWVFCRSCSNWSDSCDWLVSLFWHQGWLMV